ncbi:hypothetical protein KY290_037127 [Solanum tuberosum]|uniref:Uncharacterized protein n=1 Tax=Solanum tuberosum TaxID=4113 RepID=A0ABQ7TWD0_SOLTU|nr:hypothetical protein KY290_037127 [Solanum tuberosum]
MSTKGMSLRYVNPVMKNGEKVIELKKEEIDKATEEWKQALILYVVGDSPTIVVVERYNALQVNTVRHKCHVNEGGRTAPIKIVSKWQPKVDGGRSLSKQQTYLVLVMNGFETLNCEQGSTSQESGKQKHKKGVGEDINDN